MGLPVIDISFEQLTHSAIERSARGRVAILLSQSELGVRSYSEISEIGSELSGENADIVKMAFYKGAAKVTAANSGSNTAAALNSIANLDWDWLCMPGASDEDNAAIVTWIKAQRAEGKPFKAVVGGGSSPNCEGVVNFTTGNIKSNLRGSEKSYSAKTYSPAIAGLLAGMALDRSATGYELEDVSAADESADADADINAGKLILTYNGESYEIARAVTSLTDAAAPSLFKKIKHVEGCDLIRRDMAEIFRSLYKGKRVNSYANKQSLNADFIAYFAGLEGSVLSPDYENSASVDIEAQKTYLSGLGIDTAEMSDIEIAKSDTDERVYVKVNIQLLDAMEDVYISVMLN